MQSEERLSTRQQEEEGGGGQVNAKIEEVDAMIAQLQRRKQELVEGMNAMKKKEGRREEGDVAAVVVDARVLKALNSVNWKRFGQGKEGEWAFVMDRQGNLTRELEPAKEFIENLKKTGGQITAGKHRYKVSQDGKFLNRFEDNNGRN